MSDHDVLFYFDESGDFGYLEKEPQPGTFGVVAGFAFPSQRFDEYSTKLNSLFSQLDTENCAKIRSAFVFVGDRNESVLKKYLEFFLNSEILIAYEAICLTGAYINLQELESIKQNHPVPKDDNILILTKSRQDDIYHSVLENVVIKLDEICKIEGNNSLEMISDNLDKSILRKARKKINDLSKEKHISTYKAINKKERKKIYRSIVFQCDYPDLAVKHVKQLRLTDEAAMTFAADLIANSIYRHLKNKVIAGESNALHSPAAMKGHYLVSKIALLSDDDITDKLYNHKC